MADIPAQAYIVQRRASEVILVSSASDRAAAPARAVSNSADKKEQQKQLNKMIQYDEDWNKGGSLSSVTFDAFLTGASSAAEGTGTDQNSRGGGGAAGGGRAGAGAAGGAAAAYDDDDENDLLVETDLDDDENERLELSRANRRASRRRRRGEAPYAPPSEAAANGGGSKFRGGRGGAAASGRANLDDESRVCHGGGSARAAVGVDGGGGGGKAEGGGGDDSSLTYSDGGLNSDAYAAAAALPRPRGTAAAVNAAVAAATGEAEADADLGATYRKKKKKRGIFGGGGGPNDTRRHDGSAATGGDSHSSSSHDSDDDISHAYSCMCLLLAAALPALVMFYARFHEHWRLHAGASRHVVVSSTFTRSVHIRQTNALVEVGDGVLVDGSNVVGNNNANGGASGGGGGGEGGTFRTYHVDGHCPPLTGRPVVLSHTWDLKLGPGAYDWNRYYLNPGSVLDVTVTARTGGVKLLLFRGKTSFESWRHDPGEFKDNPWRRSHTYEGYDPATLRYQNVIAEAFYVVYSNAFPRQADLSIIVRRNLTTFNLTSIRPIDSDDSDSSCTKGGTDCTVVLKPWTLACVVVQAGNVGTNEVFGRNGTLDDADGTDFTTYGEDGAGLGVTSFNATAEDIKDSVVMVDVRGNYRWSSIVGIFMIPALLMLLMSDGGTGEGDEGGRTTTTTTTTAMGRQVESRQQSSKQHGAVGVDNGHGGGGARWRRRERATIPRSNKMNATSDNRKEGPPDAETGGGLPSTPPPPPPPLPGSRLRRDGIGHDNDVVVDVAQSPVSESTPLTQHIAGRRMEPP